MEQRTMTPWGTWEVLADAPGYKVKRITVNAGHRLSYQKHLRRAEHWFIVRGIATVTLDGREIELMPGNHIDIGPEIPHRITNRGDETVVIIEVQQGTYCGEDDIIRLEDDYGRSKEQGVRDQKGCLK